MLKDMQSIFGGARRTAEARVSAGVYLQGVCHHNSLGARYLKISQKSTFFCDGDGWWISHCPSVEVADKVISCGVLNDTACDGVKQRGRITELLGVGLISTSRQFQGSLPTLPKFTLNENRNRNRILPFSKGSSLCKPKGKLTWYGQGRSQSTQL